MSNYHQIKEKELKTTEKYSEKKMNRYINLHKILLKLYSKIFFWSISLIPIIVMPIIFDMTDYYIIFLFTHFLFWYFKGDKMYHKDCDGDIEEIKTTIQVLEDIKYEKNIKK